MKGSSCYILRKLLALNSIRIAESELELQLKSHPSYPSLHSITSVFEHLGVESIAVQVPVNVEILRDLPKSFIAHINIGDKEDFVLVEQYDWRLRLTDNLKTKTFISHEGFFDLWSGILVAIDKPEDTRLITKTNVPKRTLAIFSLIGIFGFLLMNLFTRSEGNYQILSFLFAALGIIISVFILQHELGIPSQAVEKICSGKIDRLNCNEVLNSAAARVFGKVHLSDIGLVYFSGLIMAWSLLLFSGNFGVNSIVWLSLSAIPFTIYSILYQFFSIKKFCPLCLIVLAILWSQGILVFTLPAEHSFLFVGVTEILIVAFSFFFVTVSWIYLKSLIISSIEAREVKIKHSSFKNNYEIFKTLFKRNSSLNMEIARSKELVFGCEDSEKLLEIVVITNPLCGHCKGTHEAVEPFLINNTKGIQVRIRFNMTPDDPNDLSAKMASSLLNIYHSRDRFTAIKALNEAYSEMTPEKWLTKWGDYKLKNEWMEELGIERKWCLDNQINFTPEILVNGRPFPKEYDRSDLKNFTGELIEEIIETENLTKQTA
jgi:uncharacterized membrane protein